MKIDKATLRQPSTISLIIANLFPLVGVIFFGWDTFLVVLLYWLENLIVGFYTILKIFFAYTENPLDRIFRIFPAAFFTFHYGAFCGVHGLFILFLFGNKDAEPFPQGDAWPCFFVFIQLFVNVIRHLFEAMPKEMLLILTALMISHGIGFVNNYLLNGAYLNATTKKLMNEPYPRMAVLHISIILGAFLIAAFGSPIGILIVLVILKTAFEISWHTKHPGKPLNSNPGQSDKISV